MRIFTTTTRVSTGTPADTAARHRTGSAPVAGGVTGSGLSAARMTLDAQGPAPRGRPV